MKNKNIKSFYLLHILQIWIKTYTNTLDEDSKTAET